jgi:enamine deaminase RidA (YjgF/YER057c/UK114 family)
LNAEHTLHTLGLTLPSAKAPAGNYASAVRTGNLLFISGRAPGSVDGLAAKGRFGREYSAADGYALARSACLDLLAVVKEKIGSLDAVAQFVELHGSLNAVPEFEDHAKVLDGASDLLAAVFGEAGLHARSVVGVSSLRNGVPLTLKAIVEVRAV